MEANDVDKKKFRNSFFQSLKLLKRFSRNPTKVGTIFPSSRGLALELLMSVDFKKDSMRLVEVGPGTGPVTQVILEKLSPGHEFLAIELDRELYGELIKKWDPKYFFNDNCENILDHVEPESVDGIVSCLPWTNFSQGVQQKILTELKKSLKVGGSFSTFNFLPGYSVPSAIRFRKLLQQEFTKLEISPIVWANLPPSVVYHCTK